MSHIVSSNLLIPRIFHQVWLGDRPYPDDFQSFTDGWMSRHPGWEMKRWTDENLPDIINRTEFEDGNRLAAKSDVLRYELIWRFGGVYVDTDFQCFKNIEELLDGVNAFQGDEVPDKPGNALLGGVAGDPFFTFLIEQLPESVANHEDIVDQSGPGFLKACIQKFVGPTPRVEPDSDRRRWKLSDPSGERTLWGFEPSVFYPYNFDEPHKAKGPFPNAYAAHHWNASWWKDGGI
jgi:mannosyltransferase OCH1-like enzyme